MTTFPGSPKLLKGAIVGVDLYNPLASVVPFQYNPETLTRSLSAHTTERSWWDRPARGEAVRLAGPPNETINLEVEIDAADQLERAEETATTMGIYPALASLEMLLYPKAARMIANEVLSRLGVIEVIAPETPLTLFVWGPKRVLPVRLTGFDITEQFFDAQLNPIRAGVGLSLQVLNYQDLGLASVGGALFMAHQVSKEVMATVGGFGNVSALGPSSLGIGAWSMFEPTSRYHDVETVKMTVEDGRGGPRIVSYKRRRFVPPAGTTTLAEHTVTQGDRLDNLAARYVGDPEQFWRICDANDVLRPEELTEEVGRVVRIGLPYP